LGRKNSLDFAAKLVEIAGGETLSSQLKCELKIPAKSWR
jgi:hypothetical protein